MPRLPTPGGDNGNWGEILNEYLSVSLSEDGSINDGAVTRAKLADGLKASLDSKLENITGHVTAGSNTTITGLGTQASPYQINASNSGGDVSGPASATTNVIPRYDGTTGKLLKTSGISIDNDGSLRINQQGDSRLIVMSGAANGGISLGADVNANTRSTSTRKLGIITSPNFANNADIEIFASDSTSSATNAVYFGGRTGSSRTAATHLLFFTAPDTTTTGGTERLRIDPNGNIGIGTASVTHSITLPSTATGLALYNTADQTTNYERATMAWSTNYFTIATQNAGTSSNRGIVLNGSATTVRVDNAGVNIGRATTAITALVSIASATVFNANSGTQSALALTPAINQSGTAGYSTLLINTTETATGSGSKLLADFQLGGTSKTRIDNAGSHILSNGANLTTYNTADETSNYERARHYWSSNTYTIVTEATGTGTSRNIQVIGGGTTLSLNTTGATLQRGATGVSTLFNVTSSNLNATVGTQYGLSVNPSVSQSGSAGYTMLLVNPTENTTGSGAKTLASFQVGGVTKARIDNTGSHVLSSGASVNLYNTTDETTNFERYYSGWISNVYTQALYAGGTGGFTRQMQIGLAGYSVTPNAITSSLIFRHYSGSSGYFSRCSGLK